MAVIQFNGTQAMAAFWCRQPADYRLALKTSCGKASLRKLQKGESTIQCMGRQDFEIKA